MISTINNKHHDFIYLIVENKDFCSNIHCVKVSEFIICGSAFCESKLISFLFFFAKYLVICIGRKIGMIFFTNFYKGTFIC